MMMMMMIKLMMMDKTCEYLPWADYLYCKERRTSWKKNCLNIKNFEERLLVTIIVLLKQRVNGMRLNY